MRVRVTSDNRALVLQVMKDHLHAEATYHPLPEFSYAVGPYVLTRDSRIEVGSDDRDLFPMLAALGLCDHPYEAPAPDDDTFCYPIQGHSATTLLNLTSIVSARQSLLNRALGARNAFFVARPLMSDLIAHPPTTVPEFLQALYGRSDEYRGIDFTLSHVCLTGFRTCNPDEAPIHRQLGDLIMQAALTHQWTKAFTPRVRNQKYACRTWLNSLGMIGPEYEDARRTLLSRLPGRSDQRKIPSTREG